MDSFGSRPELLEAWERGWTCLLTTLKSLKAEDLGKTVLIRGEPHSVPLALERSLGHTCYHVGQIVQVSRIHAGEKWNTLTIPRGGSEQFNKAHWGQTGKSHWWRTTVRQWKTVLWDIPLTSSYKIVKVVV